MKTNKFLSALLALAILFGTFAYAATDVTVTVNGQKIVWENSAVPYVDNDEIMLPLKKIVSALGGTYQELEAQGQQRKVAIINHKGLLIIVGSKEYTTTNFIQTPDGKFTYDEPKTYFLDNAVTEKNGDVYFPLKHFCAATGIGIKQTENTVDFILKNDIPTDTNQNNSVPESTDTNQNDDVSESTDPIVEDENIKVVLNGKKLVFDVPPQLINNRTMVPMRKIFEALGATVDWNGSTQTITAKKDDIVIVMQIDNAVISVSGKEITLDVPPQLIDNRTLVPVRAVAEGLDAEVKWDDDTQAVIITKEEKPVVTITPTPTITPAPTAASDLNGTITTIDLEKETDFICNAGAIITYGFDDMWDKTTGTGFDPFVKIIGKAYRYQTIFVSPLYANFGIDKDGKAKVTFSITRKKPNGEEATIIRDAVAFEGKVMPKQIIKSGPTLEYMIDDTDPLGVYTFTIESKDVVGNKTTTNTFYVDFSDYKYTKNEFKSNDELFNFVYNYAKNPNPDRIIDAIVYTEKNKMMTYPVLLTAFIEMLGKNPYLAESAVEVFEKEFGKGGTATLKILDSSASNYIQAIRKNNPPTLTYVGVPKEIKNDIMLFGGCVGAYLASGSYNAAKVLATALEDSKFSDDKLEGYMVPEFETLIKNDPLFKAYCIYMQLYDASVSQTVKSKLKTLLNMK